MAVNDETMVDDFDHGEGEDIEALLYGSQSDERPQKVKEKRKTVRTGSSGRRPENTACVYGVLLFASLILLVYVMLEFRTLVWAVVGASAFFLLMAGLVIHQVSIAVKAYQKKQNLLLESRLSELENRLAAASEEEQKAVKANTYYTKKIGEALAGFEDELIDNQRKGNALMQRMITTQTKSTKVLVKYNEINTNKVVTNVHNQYQQIERSLDNSMSNTNVELRKIGENIMMIQRAPQPVAYQAAPVMMPQEFQQTGEPVRMAEPAPIMEEITEPETIHENTAEVERNADEPIMSHIPEELLESIEVPALEPEEVSAMAAAEIPEESVSDNAVADAMAAMDIPDDPNAQLSPDQIAALFAAAGTADTGSTQESEPVVDEAPASDTSSENAVADAMAAMDIPDDPNAQLSPDQIAALFAAANG